MLSKNKKNINSIGSVIVSYFNRVLNFSKQRLVLEKETANYYNLLDTSLRNLIKKIIAKNNLFKVITKEQKETTKASLLRQITTEPSKYEALINEIESDSEIDSLSKEKQIKVLKAEQYLSSKLREIFLLEENPDKIINCYLIKAAFSILKDNAEGISRDYLLLNNNVKRALKELKTANIIFEPIKNRYTINPKETIIFNPKFNDLKTNNELDSELSKAKQNTKRIIKALLESNYEFNLSPKDVSTFIASVRLEEKSQSKIVNNYNEDETQQNTNENEIVVENDFNSRLIAVESMHHLIRFQGSSNTIKQKEMALLAYLYKAVSGQYFTEKILTDEQMQLEETECIENFLNDKRFCNFDKSKPVGRTTAHNRKTEALDALKNVLSDLSAEAQSVFVKEYSAYLENRFRYYRGEKK